LIAALVEMICLLEKVVRKSLTTEKEEYKKAQLLLVRDVFLPRQRGADGTLRTTSEESGLLSAIKC
jgi:hypothetical protein